MKISSHTPGVMSRPELDRAYDNPVEADLDILRVAASAFSLPTRRGHEKLPRKPRFKKGVRQALTKGEFGAAIAELEGWTNREHFDPYFCAGEMMAAFCEVLRLVAIRAAATDSSVLGEVLLDAIAFDDRLIFQLIDSSNGDQVFSGAHLHELYKAAKARHGEGDRDPTLMAAIAKLEGDEE